MYFGISRLLGTGWERGCSDVHTLYQDSSVLGRKGLGHLYLHQKFLVTLTQWSEWRSFILCPFREAGKKKKGSSQVPV